MIKDEKIKALMAFVAQQAWKEEYHGMDLDAYAAFLKEWTSAELMEAIDEGLTPYRHNQFEVLKYNERWSVQLSGHSATATDLNVALVLLAMALLRNHAFNPHFTEDIPAKQLDFFAEGYGED